MDSESLTVLLVASPWSFFCFAFIDSGVARVASMVGLSLAREAR